MIGRVLGGLLRLVGIILVAPFVLLWWLFRARVPRTTVLEIDLVQGIAEHQPADPLAAIMSRSKLLVREVVIALQRAADDDRVRSVLIRGSTEGISFGLVDDLREAILHFRSKGKRVTFFANSFGTTGPGHATYYLATACDRIYLLPSGMLGLTGLRADVVFFRDLLDRLGVLPRLDQRHEYKNAANVLTEREMTEAHRENVRQVLVGVFDQIAEATASARNIDANDARTIISSGPYMAHEAVARGLVDGARYLNDVYDVLREEHDEGLRFLPVRNYLQQSAPLFRRGPSVALIHGNGVIKQGENSPRSVMGTPTMGAETICRALRDATDDARVKAIIFRVDSPGGSYDASDAIAHEVKRAREAGKPVVVSMATVAASGGYFVSMEANKILAHPLTLTGSIGVVSGKMVVRPLLERLGITTDSVDIGENPTVWSPMEDYSPEEWQRHGEILDHIYSDFSGRVAARRGLSAEEIDRAARGRVWTGNAAREHRLIDEMGGLLSALRVVREEIGLPEDASLQLRLFPERDWKDAFKKRSTASRPHALADLARLAEPALRDLSRQPFSLMMPFGDRLQ